VVSAPAQCKPAQCKPAQCSPPEFSWAGQRTDWFRRHEGMKFSLRIERCGALVAAVLVTAACSTQTVTASSSSTPAATPAASSAAGASTDPATGSSASAGPVTVSLPVVSCPTTLGYSSSGQKVTVPTSRQVSVPSAVAGQLAVYTDSLARMELVAPKGWSCTAVYGADGSGGVVVYPHGVTVPSNWAAGWRLTATSAVSAVLGVETSACYSCALGQACRLFPAAASTLQSFLGHNGCQARPAAETVSQIGAGIMGFADPPGTSGDGMPAGGADPANGVMTYYPRAADGSWLETCTLPGTDTAECTAILNNFVSWYGQQ
jgi:hypothetical protein